jgi:16S rRNA (uracil1498-N3)-methyltransferase
VLDGHSIFAATVLATDAKRARVRVEAARDLPVVPPVALGLGFPEPKAALEAITLACEAGATSIDLVRCRYSHHAVPSADRIERVLVAAQRQCGRPRRPDIGEPVDLDRWLRRPDPRPAFVATPGAARPDLAMTPQLASQGARVLVGPEGGLSAEETATVTEAGFQPLGLGPWILRTPTAAALAIGRVLRPA